MLLMHELNSSRPWKVSVDASVILTILSEKIKEEVIKERKKRKKKKLSGILFPHDGGQKPQNTFLPQIKEFLFL